MRVKRAVPAVEERIDYALEEVGGSSPKMGLSEHQYIARLYSEFNDRLGLTKKERDEVEFNHRFYTGKDFGQWDPAVLASCKDKNLAQFNFTLKKVNSVVGHLQKNMWDTNFSSTDGTNQDTLSLIRELYYADKDLCDWDQEFETAFKNGAIRSADIMMYVNYKYDPNFGNIGIKTLDPGTVLWDVNWTSAKSEDCQNLFLTSWMTPEEIKKTYPGHSDRIDALLRARSYRSDSTELPYMSNRDATPRRDSKKEYNDRYRVVEYHHMELEKGTVKHGWTPNGQLVEVPMDASDEWYETMQVDKDSVIETETQQNIYYITTFAPDIDTFMALEDRPGRLQIGRLPFFHWSYNRHNGRDLGLVDLIKDPQVFYNDMMSMQHSVIKNAKRLKIIDRGLFPDEMSVKELEAKLNDPSATMFAEPGATQEYPNAIQESNPGTPLGNEINLAQMAVDSAQQILPGNAAMEGINTGERSALQFDIQREQGEVNMAMIQNSVKLLLREIGESYFFASQSLYGGMYRQFEAPFGNIEINIEQPDGRVLNDITAVSRAKVRITESPAALTRKTADRVIAMQVLQTLGDDPVTRSYALEIIFNSLETFPEANRRKMIESLGLTREMTITGMAANNSINKLNLLQSETQIQQMTNPQMANPGAEGEVVEGQQQEVPQEPVQQ